MSNTKKAKRPDNEPPELIKLESAPAPERETAELFSIDGETYGVWLNPPANIGLQYLKMARVRGNDIAAQWLMEQMIGEDGYEALMDFDSLTEESLKQIVNACEEHALGPKEAKKRRMERERAAKRG